MYTIEIEKNYFCDMLHPFPPMIKCPTDELFNETIESYRNSFLEQYSHVFDVVEVKHNDHIVFRVEPIIAPTNYFIHKVQFTISNDKDVQKFWDYYANEKVRAIHAYYFGDLISVAYGMIVFSMNRSQQKVEMEIKETEYAHVLELKGVCNFTKESLDVLMNDKPNIKYHFLDGIYRLYCSKEFSNLSDEIELIKKEEKVESHFVGISKENHSGAAFNDEKEKEESPFSGKSTDNHARLTFNGKEEDRLHLYDFLDYYELDELIELLSELNSMILVLSSSEFSETEIHFLTHYLISISKILISSHESFSLGMNITLLEQGIITHKERFLEHSQSMSNLCGAFSHDLSQWVKKLFFEGAPSLHFLDDSIISNCETILALLKDEEDTSASLDDIFDF